MVVVSVVVVPVVVVPVPVVVGPGVVDDVESVVLVVVLVVGLHGRCDEFANGGFTQGL